jgi:hypothetical protein
MTHLPTNAELMSIYAHRHVRGEMSAEELWKVSVRELRIYIHSLKEDKRNCIRDVASIRNEIVELQAQQRIERDDYQNKLDTQAEHITRLQTEVDTWMKCLKSQQEKTEKEHQDLMDDIEEWRGAAAARAIQMDNMEELMISERNKYNAEVEALMMRIDAQKDEVVNDNQLDIDRRECASSTKKTHDTFEDFIKEDANLKTERNTKISEIPIPEISTLIFNNKYGDGKHYSDQSREESGEFIYMGQKKGRNDPYIIPNQTLYLDRSKNDMPYVYRGLITHKETINPNTGSGATYKLTLDTTHIYKGIHSGQILPLVEGVPRGRGKCCMKRSCLSHLQVEAKDSLCIGILRVKSI